MIKLITGAPGCGKTTTYVQKLAEETSGMVWVLEPIQKIVENKRKGVKLPNLRYVNWALGFGKSFSQGKDAIDINDFSSFKKDRGDIIVVDEAHQLFYSEYREFWVRGLQDLIETFKDSLIVFITATPLILKNILDGDKMGNGKIDYEEIAIPQRLERKKFKINIIPTIYTDFITEEAQLNYDITLTNNIKKLKLVSLMMEKHSGFDYIYSTYNEFNNVLFPVDKVVHDSNNKWIGTIALGQGIDKEKTVNSTKDVNVLIDANNLMQLPDVIKEHYERKKYLNKEEFEQIKETREGKGKEKWQYLKNLHFLYGTGVAENVIQIDRFRYDIDTFNIDILINVDSELLITYSDAFENYFKYVYGDDVDLEISISHGLYKNTELGKFKAEILEKCLRDYNIYHQNNTKDLGTRFYELLEELINNLDDNNKRGNLGTYGRRLIYYDILFKKFIGLMNNINDLYDNHLLKIPYDDLIRYYVICYTLKSYFNYFKTIDIKQYVKTYIDEKSKDKEWLAELEQKYSRRKTISNKIEEKLKTEFYTYMEYLGESFLQIFLNHIGFKYSMADELTKRGGSPLQLLTKPLRAWLILKDWDITAAHMAAIIKKIMGVDYVITKETIESLYTYKALGGEERVINHLKSFGKRNKTKTNEDGEIVNEEPVYIFGTERQNCKDALLWSLNRPKKAYWIKPEESIDYILIRDALSTIIGDKANDIFSIRKIGYDNGIVYEKTWLSEYNGYKGVIYRMSDGLCQVYGNEEFIDNIVYDITKEHKIYLKEENLDKFREVLGNISNGSMRTFDYFFKKVYGNMVELDVDKIEDEIKIDKLTSDMFTMWNSKLDINIDMLVEATTLATKAMEDFRRYVMKGKHKGKAKGKAIGKALHKKKYEIVEDFIIKRTGSVWVKNIYEWDYIPKEITKHYQIKYLRHLETLK